MFDKKAVSLCILSLILAAFPAVSGYTLRYGVEIMFPRQIPGEESDRAFQRYDYTNIVRLLFCPEKYHFDQSLLKCVRSAKSQTKDIRYCPQHGDENDRGQFPYPMNCRKFVNCWDGREHVQECNDHLVFDNVTKGCNYPEMADCCEYPEKGASFDVFEY